MTEYHGRHNTAATKGLKIARLYLIKYWFPKRQKKCAGFVKQAGNTIMITFRLNMSQELTTPYGNMPTSAVRLGQRHVLAV